MFSKSKINDPAPQDADASKPAPSSASAAPAPSKQSEFKASAPKAKPPASVLSSDLHVTGNMKTTGDVQVEGTVYDPHLGTCLVSFWAPFWGTC